MAVARIKQLARERVYDGLLFHRVIDGYVDQTGNPNNRDGGVSDHPNLAPEFRVSLTPAQMDAVATTGPGEMTGFIGATPFQASPDPARPGSWRVWAAYCDGVAGMGRESDPASANSEIFFMRAANRSLDHDYTPWGRVVSGLDVVQHMAVGEPPAQPDRMIKVSVMMDMKLPDQPKLHVINTRSAAFESELNAVRRRLGENFSVCDVKITTRLRFCLQSGHSAFSKAVRVAEAPGVPPRSGSRMRAVSAWRNIGRLPTRKAPLRNNLAGRLSPAA